MIQSRLFNNTEPIDPETSTREDPINARLIKTLDIIGLRHIGNINILRINPLII